MAQEVQRDQITEQIVWQRHIDGAQGCVAQATGCQLPGWKLVLEALCLLGRPGLRIFDVLIPLTAILDALL